jgi:hypothetical protein
MPLGRDNLGLQSDEKASVHTLQHSSIEIHHISVGLIERLQKQACHAKSIMSIQIIFHRSPTVTTVHDSQEGRRRTVHTETLSFILAKSSFCERPEDQGSAHPKSRWGWWRYELQLPAALP